MKKIKINKKSVFVLGLFIFVFTGFLKAQSPPQMINYQGVARDVNGNPVANSPISLKFEIIQGSPTGATVFAESQTGITTNVQGLFNTQIGKTAALGIVNWKNGPSFLKVSVDLQGGSSYAALGAPQQIVSVPYALYADSTAAPAMTFTNGILTVNHGTVSIASSGITPNLSVSNNSLTIGGGNTVPLTAVTATNGASIVNQTSYGYDVNTPSVTVNPHITALGLSGLAQIMGTYPNYSVVVAPAINYNQATGNLILTNNPLLGATPSYTYSYYITPAPNLIGNVLSVGPSTNSVDFNPIAPWRWNQTTNQVTLATVSPTQAVGINTINAACALDVNGYTKLGATAPQIQIAKMTGLTPNVLNQGQQINFPSGVAQNKIIAVSVLVDAGTGTGFGNLDWIPPSYTVLPQFEYHWRITNGGIVIVTTAANSSAILNKQVRILITYEQ